MPYVDGPVHLYGFGTACRKGHEAGHDLHLPDDNGAVHVYGFGTTRRKGHEAGYDLQVRRSASALHLYGDGAARDANTTDGDNLPDRDATGHRAGSGYARGARSGLQSV